MGPLSYRSLATESVQYFYGFSYIATYSYVAMHVLCNSCNIGTSDLPDVYAQSPRAYISGKSRVPKLQLICNIAQRAEVSSSQKSQNRKHLYIYWEAY